MTLLEFASVAFLLLVVVALFYNAFATPGSWTDALAVIRTSFELVRGLLHI